MFLFVPIVSKLEEEYTPTQRDKFIFNHERYLGNEDCTAIHGLEDLNTILLLSNNVKVSLRTLLKGIPAPTGMSTARLFQVVDPNATQICTLVTFPKRDRPLVAQSLDTLKDTILSHLAPHQQHLVFKNPATGIRFVDAYHKNRGKFIKIHDPLPEHVAFLNRSNSTMSSPLKKRSVPDPYKDKKSSASAAATSVTYSGIVQCTTSTKSVEQPSGQGSGTTTTTTTQTSQTVTAVMETRFQAIERQVSSQRAAQIRIEEKQERLDNRLGTLERQNHGIGSNIAAMMSHLNIPTVTSLTFPPPNNNTPQLDVVDAHHTTLQNMIMEDNCF